MNSLGKTGKPRQEELVDNLCQLTVCQMSEEMGFIGGLRESSLHTLSDVLQRYIQEIGDCAASKATANGRTQVNYFDIEYVLENEMNCSISQLNHFETYSSLLPSFIHDGTENDDELKIDREKRAQKNGTVLMIDDETDDLLSSLYAQSHSKMDNSNKSNKKSKNKSKSINSNGRKNNDHHHNNINDDDTNISSGHSKRHNKKKQHIPPYCPNYPPALLYKHTEVFYRHTSSHSSGKMNNGSGIADRNLVEIEDNENFDILNDNNDNNNNNDKNKKKKQKKKDKNNKNKKTNDNENDDINMDGSNDIDDDGIGGSGGGIFANETSDVAKTRRVMIRNPSLFQKKESHQQHQHQQQTQLNGNAIPPKKRLRVDASGKSVGTKGGGDGEFQLFDLP